MWQVKESTFYFGFANEKGSDVKTKKFRVIIARKARPDRPPC